METKEVIIQLINEDRLVEVPNSKSIMETALDVGVKLIHSCLKGQCGSCRAFLVSGKVEMKNNFSLFEEELKEGQILLCQSFPISNNVMVKPIRQPKPR